MYCYIYRPMPLPCIAIQEGVVHTGLLYCQKLTRAHPHIVPGAVVKLFLEDLEVRVDLTLISSPLSFVTPQAAVAE